MSFRRGVRLGHYEIDCLRGAGGMGEVYRSRDVRLDRTSAPVESTSPLTVLLNWQPR